MSNERKKIEKKPINTVVPKKREVEKPKEVEQLKDFDPNEFSAKVCSLDNPDCESCGA